MRLRNASLVRASFVVFATSLVVWLMELTLPRLYSILFDYHFTFLSISLTLSGLGLGAAAYHKWTGAPEKLAKRLGLLLCSSVVSILLLALLVTTTSFLTNIYIIIGLSMIPFSASGAMLAHAFTTRAANSASLFAIDLAGALAGIGLFVLLSELGALPLLVLGSLLLGGLAPALISEKRWSLRVSFFAGILFVGAITAGMVTGKWSPRIALQPGYHKEMYHLQQHPGLKGEVVASKWSAFGRTDLLASDAEPDKMVFFIDGSAGSSMYRFNGDYTDTIINARVNSLKGFPAFVSLELIPPDQKQSALIIGPGGGRDIHLLRLAGFKDITAVEVNGDLLSLARTFDDYNGGLFTGKIPGIRVIEGEGRSFIRRLDRKFDVIYLSIPIIKSSRSPESFSLTENFLFTQGAFEDYFSRLTDDGRIIVVAHDRREILKLTLTAEKSLASLNQSKSIYDHIFAAGAGMNPYVVFKKTPFAKEESELLHEVIMATGDFNPAGAFFPFIEPHDVNLLLPGEKILTEPMLSYELSGLASGAYTSNQLIAASDLNLAPPDDGSPFFYSFQRGVPLVINVTILIAGLLVLFVVLRALRLNRESVTLSLLWVSVFIALGIGFLLLEIPLIQIFVLFLGRPMYGLTVVLVSLLLGGVAGSYLSGKIKVSDRTVLVGASLLVILIILAHMYFVPDVLEFYGRENLNTRIAISFLMLLPLGFAIAMPFPTVLRYAAVCRLDDTIPVFWSVNGLASVFGAATAVAVSIAFGFTSALTMAAGLYGFVALVGYRLR